MNILYLKNELKRLANDESGVGVIEVECIFADNTF